MQKLQLKYQKFVVFLALVVSAANFVYALGFATDIYNLNYHSNPVSKRLYVEGAELYQEVQPFNHRLLLLALILFIINIALFVFITHKRRKYYPTNYVTTLAYSGMACYIGWFIRSNNAVYKAMYLNIDFDRLKQITIDYNLRFSKSTLFLDIGLTFGFILYGIAALLIVNLVWKTIIMSAERNRLRGCNA